MGKKIFVSYKYADNLVRQLPNIYDTTVRNYVDILQEKIDKNDHINKGEDDGENMSTLADSTIASKLGDKIFDSTVTIVFISKGMKENIPEKDQWIPWEISYSLSEQSREYGNSKTNAVLAVVLPDNFNSYEYYIKNNVQCGSRTLMTNFLFNILKENMFNINNPDTRECNGNIIYNGYSSYINSIKWDDFIIDIEKHIQIAIDIWRNRNNYTLKKRI